MTSMRGKRTLCLSGLASCFFTAFKAFTNNTSRDEEALHESTQSLLNQRKLHLVLDIDHTLLHAVSLAILTPRATKRLNDTIKSSSQDVSLLKLKNIRLLVKLRPFLRTFLKDASSLFEMSLYTTGGRSYAKSVAKLLDPQGFYFADRIISREDTPTNYKTLDLIDVEERAIVIVDDTEYAWRGNDKGNLLVIERYKYFVEINNAVYFKSIGSDESETEGGLARMLRALKELHERFFKESDDCADIRVVIESICGSTLKGINS